MVKKRIYRILFVLIIFIAWEIVVKLGIYNIVLLPSLSDISKEFVKEILNGELLFAVLNSVYKIFTSLFYSIIISLVLVGISNINDVIDNLVDFVVAIAHPIPGIAILPLVIMWFGIGEKAVYAIMLHSMIWPMIINIKTEIKRLKIKYSKIGLVYNLSFISELINIYIIGSVPSILSGSKIAWSRGWRAFISAEMIFGVVGTSSGLGWYLFEQRVYMDSPGLYSGVLAIIICGVFIESVIFDKLDKLTYIPWGRL